MPDAQANKRGPMTSKKNTPEKDCLHEKRSPERVLIKKCSGGAGTLRTKLSEVSESIELAECQPMNTSAGSIETIITISENSLNEEREAEIRKLQTRIGELESQVRVPVWDCRPTVNPRDIPWQPALIGNLGNATLLASSFLWSFKIKPWDIVTYCSAFIIFVFDALLRVAAWCVRKNKCATYISFFRDCFPFCCVLDAYIERPHVLHWTHSFISGYFPSAIIFLVILFKGQLVWTDIFVYCIVSIIALFVSHHIAFPFTRCSDGEKKSTSGDLNVSYFTTFAKLLSLKFAGNSNPANKENECNLFGCCG